MIYLLKFFGFIIDTTLCVLVFIPLKMVYESYFLTAKIFNLCK